MLGIQVFNKPNDKKFWADECVEFNFRWLTEELQIPPEEITFIEDVWAGGGNLGPSIEYFVSGLEVGNMVFMQYKTFPDGSREPLQIQVCITTRRNQSSVYSHFPRTHTHTHFHTLLTPRHPPLCFPPPPCRRSSTSESASSASPGSSTARPPRTSTSSRPATRSFWTASSSSATPPSGTSSARCRACSTSTRSTTCPRRGSGSRTRSASPWPRSAPPSSLCATPTSSLTTRAPRS